MLATLLLQIFPLVPAVLAGTVQYPEVVPGPGFPSLESLGLTSEKLYTMEPASSEVNARASFAPMFTAVCAADSRAYTDVNDLMACENYLNSIGSQDCTVPGDFKKIWYCRAGNAEINGLSITARSRTSPCSSVAHAVRWVTNHCKRYDNKAAGFEAAFGDGDIIVSGVSREFS
ncbi:hypothetical protein MY11210_002848 [Beauveria gryllotalpidicola]